MEILVLAEPLTQASVLDFDTLVHAHARFVLNVAYSVLQNNEDAEDVVQETFLRAFRSGEWARIDRMRAWLARIAWRLAINRAHQRSAQRSASESEDVIEALPSRGKGADDLLLMKEREVLLGQLLRTLPSELREAFTLLTVEGMTSSEAAEILSISESSVRDRWLRARRVLKDKLSARIGRMHGS